MQRKEWVLIVKVLHANIKSRAIEKPLLTSQNVS